MGATAARAGRVRNFFIARVAVAAMMASLKAP
jgi:hypothetical protein